MINLAPPEIREQIKYGRLNVLVLKYLLGLGSVAIIVAGVVMLGLLLTGNRTHDLEDKLAYNNSRYEEYGDTLSDAELLSGDIDTIKALLDREFKFSEVLEKISALIPTGASLDNITLSNKEDTLQLSTSLETQELATVFQKNMAESGLFSVTDIQSVANSSEGGYSAVFIVTFSPDASPVSDPPLVEGQSL
jgi:hypothetical protein